MTETKQRKRELRIIILLIVVCMLVFSWWITELRIENLEAKNDLAIKQVHTLAIQ